MTLAADRNLQGWLAPPGGHRGSRFSGSAVEMTSLSRGVSLEPLAPLPLDQGRLGSCTGYSAACGIATKLRFQAQTPETAWIPAPLDLYLGGRLREGTQASDAGAVIFDVLKHAEERGVAPWSLWGDADFRGPAPSEIIAERGKTRLVNWEPLDWDVDTLRWEISCGNPLLVGARVFDNIMSVGRDGLVPMPVGSAIGGHALCVIGYDDDRRALRIQNSWGVEWGDAGRAWLPYDYVTSPAWCGEIHSIRVVRSA